MEKELREQQYWIGLTLTIHQLRERWKLSDVEILEALETWIAHQRIIISVASDHRQQQEPL